MACELEGTNIEVHSDADVAVAPVLRRRALADHARQRNRRIPADYAGVACWLACASGRRRRRTAAAVAESGEVIDAIQARVLSPEDLRELGDLLVTGFTRTPMTVFESVGVAIQDSAVAKALSDLTLLTNAQCLLMKLSMVARKSSDSRSSVLTWLELPKITNSLSGMPLARVWLQATVNSS